MREFDLRIPVANWLLSRGLSPILECASLNNCDMIGLEIRERKIVRMVAVELKLTDVAGVIRQCRSHLPRVNETWAAMPAQSLSTEQRMAEEGIGFLEVSPPMARVKVDAVCTDDLDLSPWKCLYRRRDEYKWRMEHPQMLRFPALKIIKDRNELMESLL